MNANFFSRPATRGKPVAGIACLAVALFALTAPFMLNRVDVYLRDFVPFAGLFLAALAFIRRERVLWPIIGLLLTTFYVALHFIPCC